MKAIRTLALGFFATTAVLACAEGTQSSGARTPETPVAGSEAPAGVTQAQNAVDERVADKLASARCDREQKCDQIGQGRKYATREVCQTQLRSDTMSDLNAKNCPRGLDQGAVDHCLSAIQAEPCTLSVDTFARIADCRAGAICMK
jgi:hypothetical protein